MPSLVFSLTPLDGCSDWLAELLLKCAISLALPLTCRPQLSWSLANRTQTQWMQLKRLAEFEMALMLLLPVIDKLTFIWVHTAHHIALTEANYAKNITKLT